MPLQLGIGHPHIPGSPLLRLLGQSLLKLLNSFPSASFEATSQGGTWGRGGRFPDSVLIKAQMNKRICSSNRLSRRLSSPQPPTTMESMNQKPAAGWPRGRGACESQARLYGSCCSQAGPGDGPSLHIQLLWSSALLDVAQVCAVRLEGQSSGLQ